ncbi:MAG: patatin-like phospholipase family protein [Anaerolineales bacterium]|nr:patatin-like phospholipase family protein [Anaerolineales bacterium]
MSSGATRLPLTLALGGGGMKCVAEAAVLAVLEEAGLPIGPLVGVSGGGIVAVLYAAGFTPLQIRDEFQRIHLLEVWEPDPERQALFGASRIRARFRELVGEKTFADLRRPAVAMAMNFHTAQPVPITSGTLADALTATMAIPGLFQGVARGEELLVDCGVINPLPVDVARQLGPRVVAVDVLHHDSLEEADNIIEPRGPLRYAAGLTRQLGVSLIIRNGYQAIKIGMQRLTEWNLATYPPDVLLRPAVGPVGLFGSHQAEQAYLMGEAATRAALPQLEALAQAPSGWRGLWQRLRRPSPAAG